MHTGELLNLYNPTKRVWINAKDATAKQSLFFTPSSQRLLMVKVEGGKKKTFTGAERAAKSGREPTATERPLSR